LIHAGQNGGMKRPIVVLELIVVVAAAIGLWFSRPQAPRVVEAGPAVLAIRGHGWLAPRPDTPFAGVGLDGTLVLINDACVGLRQGPPGADSHHVMLLWPSGTDVEGEGADIVIHSGGRSVRIGDDLQGGTSGTTVFPEVQALLPERCVNVTLQDFALDG
jgi:hypothetical protein